MYAVSADPITKGHIRLVERASNEYDEVVLAIGINAEKKYLFTADQRQEMARRSLAHLPKVRVDSFQGLLVDYAYAQSIEYLIRGVRDERDREVEQVYAAAVRDQNLGIKVDFIEAEETYKHISSSLVKATAVANGLFGLRPNYVTPYVKQCLEAKLLGQYFVGVTGAIGCGKSYACKELVKAGQAKNIPIQSVDLDHIGHLIIKDCNLPMAVRARQEIVKYFGKAVLCGDGSIDRKKLGEMVFGNPHELQQLNQILAKPMFVYLRDQIISKMKGVILLEAALFAESGIADWCNYNIVLVGANEKVQKDRVSARDGLSAEQIERRINSQFSGERKKELLAQQIKDNGHGKLWEFDNSEEIPGRFERLLEQVVAEMDIYGVLGKSK